MLRSRNRAALPSHPYGTAEHDNLGDAQSLIAFAATFESLRTMSPDESGPFDCASPTQSNHPLRLNHSSGSAPLAMTASQASGYPKVQSYSGMFLKFMPQMPTRIV